MSRRIIQAALALPVVVLGFSGRSSKAYGNDEQNRYVGLWVTADGYVRHELKPGGRYDEARGARESAYQGRYRLQGNRIEYVDDTGFTADGEFKNGVLYHGGMVLRREVAK